MGLKTIEKKSTHTQTQKYQKYLGHTKGGIL